MAEPNTTRAYNMGPAANLNIQTEQAQAAVNQMTAAMKGLEKALQDFGNSAYAMADKINRHLKSIGDTATKVTQQIAGMGSAVGAVGAVAAPTGRATATAAPAVGTGGSRAQQWVSSATSAIDRVVNKDIAGGLSLGTFVGTGGGEGAAGLAKDLALSPLRYLRSRINTNRDTAIMASGAMNMVAQQQGVGSAGIMNQLSQFPGSIYGTPQDLLGLFSSAPALGASFGFGGRGQQGQGVRAQGFLKGIREMQTLNPMAPVNELQGQLGGYAADTGAQQRSMMLTGGAMSMIGAGGRQKSLSEWAESILRWFEGMRPGKDRGKGFDYGQLMAQYFPGSNIDAWFQVNGVPQNMRDYWWTYALGKANRQPDTSAKYTHVIAPEETNVAWQRLRAGSELTRTEFSLAGKMSGQYAQRESSNRWFNELMGSIQETIIPALSKSVFRWIQFLPDSLEDLMMTGAERGMSALLGGSSGAGDVGDVDIGDAYGALGGTSTSGLHPDMKNKVGAMLRANPRLKVNSGLRDVGLQRKLREGGNSRVSGKSSAHTRGMAADLGPPSQYGWISKNAKKFGLASGRGHGEPWHVGMPGDVPGVGDVFDDFLDSIRDIASSPEGMAGFITKMLSTMTGALGKLIGAGGAEEPQTQFAASPDDLYRRLAGASQKVTLGIPVDRPGGGGAGGGGSEFEDRLNVPGGAGGGSYFSGFSSSNSIDRAAATAGALYQAGFRGTNLEKMTAIAGRESSWTPTAHRTTKPKSQMVGDRGLFQINYVNDPMLKQRGIIRSAGDLFNPATNARAAYVLSSSGTNLSPWSMTAGGWAAHGDPMYGAKTAEATEAMRLAKERGWIGDIPEPGMAYDAMTQTQQAAPVIFNNQFSLSVPSYGGSSNGGIDVRRTVNLIADHLEDEMKRRLARTA